MTERVLIVGSGGREHALGWKIKQSANSPDLYFAPGNGGTQQIGTNLDIEATEVNNLARFSSDNKVGLTVVGPESPLGEGIVNVFNEDRLPIFGPTQEAARLETSKSWAIDFMKRHNIPQPKSVVFTDLRVAMHFFDEPVWKDFVIKADGLASGKGVFLPDSKEEATNAIKRIMIDREFDNGSRIVIQERLRGKEISFLAFTDGKIIVPLLPAQDHKRVNDNDKGHNTGGMGAFAPAASMDKELVKQVYDRILKPTVEGMGMEGNLFKGVLYAGLMMTNDGPKVLEYNVRFGDPETQPLMMLLSSDLLKALKNTSGGRLKKSDIGFRRGAAVCVVLAAEGYPEKPITGDEIHGLESITDPNIQLFHAGTVLENGKVITNGGRIVDVTAYGKNRGEARKILYPYIRKNGPNFRGMHYRKDIGL